MKQVHRLKKGFDSNCHCHATLISEVNQNHFYPLRDVPQPGCKFPTREDNAAYATRAATCFLPVGTICFCLVCRIADFQVPPSTKNGNAVTSALASHVSSICSFVLLNNGYLISSNSFCRQRLMPCSVDVFPCSTLSA